MPLECPICCHLGDCRYMRIDKKTDLYFSILLHFSTPKLHLHKRIACRALLASFMLYVVTRFKNMLRKEQVSTKRNFEVKLDSHLHPSLTIISRCECMPSSKKYGFLITIGWHKTVPIKLFHRRQRAIWLLFGVRGLTDRKSTLWHLRSCLTPKNCSAHLTNLSMCIGAFGCRSRRHRQAEGSKAKLGGPCGGTQRWSCFLDEESRVTGTGAFAKRQILVVVSLCTLLDNWRLRFVSLWDAFFKFFSS